MEILGASLQHFTTLDHPRFGILFDGNSRNVGVDLRFSGNPSADGQLLGFAPHSLKRIFTRVMISSVDSLPECSWGGAKKSVMRIPRYLCLQKAYAGAKKKHGHFSQTQDSDIISKKEWLLSKPSGFGERIVYDTSLEEKLLEEIKRDTAAQAAALVKRQKKAQAKIDQNKTKERAEFECQPGVVEVWVGNLPKKKNIKRDLQEAYKNVSGLLHIKPSEVGNEKTRDPICKGFGSLFFGNIISAESFISSFGDELVRFGSIQKKVSYKILKDSGSTSDIPLSKHWKDSTNSPRLRVRDKRAVLDASFESICALRRTDLQPESIFPSMLDTENPEDGMTRTYSSDGTWNADNESDVIDSELSKKRKELCNPLKSQAETTVQKPVDDIDLGDVSDGSNGESQQHSFTNIVFPSQKDYLHNLSTDSGDSLYEDKTVFSRRDQTTNLIANNTRRLENSVSNHLVAEAGKQKPPKGPLSQDEKRIEALEKRLLSKMKDAGFESNEKDSRQQQLKQRGFKPLKSKPSKQTLGSNLGSASRLQKKERKFITDTLIKYGRQEGIIDS